jgi:acetyl esterase/lipase
MERRRVPGENLQRGERDCDGGQTSQSGGSRIGALKRAVTTALKLSPLAGVAASLAACSTVGVLNTIEPKFGVVTTRDIVYQAGDRGGLDVYRPRGANGSTPVVVFFYGGGWDSGRKSDYSFIGDALASKGFVTVIPDYRIYPQVRWPAFLEDNANAVRWARDHAAEFGGDPGKLFLAGHSAGAYNAVMLSLDRRWLAAVGMDPRRDLRGTVGLAGPYDFLPLHTQELKAIFGPPQTLPQTQPITYVDGHEPPLFLATDADDKVVDPGNTTRLAEKVRAVGGSVETKIYPGLSHALLLGAVAAPLRFLAPVLKDMTAFINGQLDPHAKDGAHASVSTRSLRRGAKAAPMAEARA